MYSHKINPIFVIILTVMIAVSSLRTIAANTSACQADISTLISQVQTLESTVQGGLPDAQQDALLSPLLSIANDLNAAQKGQYDQLNAAQSSVVTFKSTAAEFIGYNQGAFDSDLKLWINTANQLSNSLTGTYQVCAGYTSTTAGS
ncbi:MAG: hypothetical protein ACHQ03_07020 [Candidatus Bathyarchaeia archaeon]